MAVARGSTYSLLTADNILRKLGVKMTKKDIAKQLASPDSFYRRVLQLPAEQLYNVILMDQTRAITDYARYLLYDAQAKIQRATKLSESGGEADTSMPLTSVTNQVNQLGEDLQNLETQMTDINQANSATDTELSNTLKEQITAWETLNQESFQTLLNAFTEVGVTLTEEQQGNLLRRLDQQGADIEIPEDTLKSLKIKGELNAVQKIVLMTLMELEDDS